MPRPGSYRLTTRGSRLCYKVFQWWMEENEWESLSDMRGNMGLLRVPDPKMYERANYMWMLQGWDRL